MALSNTEKGRLFRERQRQKRKAAQASTLSGIMKKPFYKWADERSALGYAGDFQMALNIAGLPAPSFDDDSGPASHDGQIEALHDFAGTDGPYANASNSLGRAEVMIGALISAAEALARAVQEYKLSEITDRLNEANKANFNDEAGRKAAFEAALKLEKMKDELGKVVRFTFPQWKVTGE